MTLIPTLARAVTRWSFSLTVRGDDVDGMPPKVKAGDTVWIEFEVRDNTQRLAPLADPGSGVKITIQAPSLALVVDAQDMQRLSTGRYGYAYLTNANGAYGDYTVKAKAVDAVVGFSLSTVAFTTVQ